MTTVIFVRHGEMENPNEVAPFRAVGYPLSKEGTEHVRRLAKVLSKKEVAAIYSSPILRCQQTAEIIGKQLQKTVSVDERLIEVNSPFAEMKLDELKAIWVEKSLYENPEQVEKGESAEAIVARMRSFLDEVLEKYADKTVIAVSHGDPIMLLWCSLLGKNVYSLRGNWPEYVPRAGYYELVFNGTELISEKLATS